MNFGEDHVTRSGLSAVIMTPSSGRVKVVKVILYNITLFTSLRQELAIKVLLKSYEVNDLIQLSAANPLLHCRRNLQQ